MQAYEDVPENHLSLITHLRLSIRLLLWRGVSRICKVVVFRAIARRRCDRLVGDLCQRPRYSIVAVPDGRSRTRRSRVLDVNHDLHAEARKTIKSWSFRKGRYLNAWSEGACLIAVMRGENERDQAARALRLDRDVARRAAQKTCTELPPETKALLDRLQHHTRSLATRYSSAPVIDRSLDERFKVDVSAASATMRRGNKLEGAAGRTVLRPPDLFDAKAAAVQAPTGTLRVGFSRDPKPRPKPAEMDVPAGRDRMMIKNTATGNSTSTAADEAFRDALKRFTLRSPAPRSVALSTDDTSVKTVASSTPLGPRSGESANDEANVASATRISISNAAVHPKTSTIVLEKPEMDCIRSASSVSCSSRSSSASCGSSSSSCWSGSTSSSSSSSSPTPEPAPTRTKAAPTTSAPAPLPAPLPSPPPTSGLSSMALPPASSVPVGPAPIDDSTHVRSSIKSPEIDTPCIGTLRRRPGASPTYRAVCGDRPAPNASSLLLQPVTVPEPSPRHDVASTFTMASVVRRPTLTREVRIHKNGMTSISSLTIPPFNGSTALKPASKSRFAFANSPMTNSALDPAPRRVAGIVQPNADIAPSEPSLTKRGLRRTEPGAGNRTRHSADDCAPADKTLMVARDPPALFVFILIATILRTMVSQALPLVRRPRAIMLLDVLLAVTVAVCVARWLH